MHRAGPAHRRGERTHANGTRNALPHGTRLAFRQNLMRATGRDARIACHVCNTRSNHYV
ncbi:hypothetical protein BGLA2_990130 [Burkholderia gladioli]|nr:hypothetical protein BGLA2_990130 [Burkholderia gladioli]